MPSLTDVGILFKFGKSHERADPSPDEFMWHSRSSCGFTSSASVHLTEFECAFVGNGGKTDRGTRGHRRTAVLLSNAPAVATLALQQRLPSCGWPDFAVAGGLIAYGVDFLDLFRRAATFVSQ